MQPIVRYIIITGVSLGCLSMLYFLSLLLYLPFFIALPVIFGVLLLLIKWLTTSAKTNGQKITPYPVIGFLALVGAIILIIQKSYDPAYKYGGWDAWCFWNLHARFLSGGVATWKNIFITTFAGHPDYPLLGPGVNGFFMHLFPGSAFVTIPFVLGFTITLFIPVLIYFENLRKNIIIAILVLFLMAQDAFYLFNGVSQYSDIIVAFFFLGSVICLKYAEEDKRNVFLAAACAGCCAWTKNEGVVIAAVLILFNLRRMLANGNYRYFIAGIVMPIVVLVIFKIGFSPQNDMVSGQGSGTWKRLLDATRYQLIYNHFGEQMDKNFTFLKIGFFLYLILCMAEKRAPDRQFFMILACMAAYMFVYVLSPMDLEWQLSTSLDRLLLQLSPVMIYIFSQRFCRIRISLESVGDIR